MSLIAHLGKCLTLNYSRLLPYVNVFFRTFSTADNVLCRECVDNAVKEMSSLL